MNKVSAKAWSGMITAPQTTPPFPLSPRHLHRTTSCTCLAAAVAAVPVPVPLHAGACLAAPALAISQQRRYAWKYERM